jgi:predicted RNA polymerase sigma factor
VGDVGARGRISTSIRDVTPDAAVEDLLRGLVPPVLGALVRRYGHFDAAEDAVQEALLAASLQLPQQGLPPNPLAWLITVASRRLTALSPTSQVALTLRAVGGLTTAEIASAFLIPEATSGQRVSRAKQRIRVTGIPSACPARTSGKGGSAWCCGSST